jgi:hypothetical protein
MPLLAVMPGVRERITPIADIAKSGTPSLATAIPCPAHQVAEGSTVAGEAIAAGDVCYVKAADALVYRAIGTAVNEAARAWGIAARAANIGEPVTLHKDVAYHYGAALTIGTPLYVGTAAGALADAATTGGLTKVAHVISATRIRFKGDL